MKRYICVFILIWPFVLSAQADSTETSAESLPILNNHYFTPNLIFKAPFITTFLETGVGTGTSLSEIPVSLLGGKVEKNIKAENAFVTVDVQVQIEVKEWLAAWLHYQANARIGTTTPTILAHGVTSITGFEFGWLLRLWHDERNLLSGSININNSTVSAINLPKFWEDIIDSLGSGQATLTKENNPLSGGIGLRYAHGFNDVWGMQAMLEASYGESMLKENESVWKFNLGLLASISFIQRYEVPLGLTIGYTARRFSLFESKQEDNVSTFFIEITYVHKHHYNIGLNLGYQKIGAPLLLNVNKLEFFATMLTLVYYF